MSLFGSLMGDFEDDPIFGTHMQSMQQMNSMMNSFFGNPFGMMVPSEFDLMRQDYGQSRPHQNHPSRMPRNSWGPLLLPGARGFASNFDNMAVGGNCHGMTSTSIMTYTNGPDGRPQIYQASKSTRAVPGGIKEVKESVYDSRSGTKKLAIGHHIGDRAHIIEKKKDLNNGDEEEHQEFINLDDDEAEAFNHEFQSSINAQKNYCSKRANRALTDETTHHRKRSDPKRLALTDGTVSQHSNRSRLVLSPRRNGRYLLSSSRNSRTSGGKVVELQENVQQDEVNMKTSTETSSRKRERNADNETSNKRHMSNSHD